MKNLFAICFHFAKTEVAWPLASLIVYPSLLTLKHAFWGFFFLLFFGNSLLASFLTTGITYDITFHTGRWRLEQQRQGDCGGVVRKINIETLSLTSASGCSEEYANKKSNLKQWRKFQKGHLFIAMWQNAQKASVISSPLGFVTTSLELATQDILLNSVLATVGCASPWTELS